MTEAESSLPCAPSARWYRVWKGLVCHFLKRIGAGIIKKQLAAIIEREGPGYVSLCPELDIASQGDTIEEARENLQEAVELFFETASPSELHTRLHDEVYITRVEVSVG